MQRSAMLQFSDNNSGTDDHAMPDYYSMPNNHS
jgi:hypothetical protein